MMLSFKQFIAEAIDADLDLNQYGAWLNVKTGKVVHVPQMGHVVRTVLDKLKLPKDISSMIGDLNRQPLGMRAILNKTPWVRVIFPTGSRDQKFGRGKMWNLNYGKQNRAGILKWMKGWLEDTTVADTVVLDQEPEKTEGKAKPGLLSGTLVQLDFKADPLAAKRGLVKALSRG